MSKKTHMKIPSVEGRLGPPDDYLTQKPGESEQEFSERKARWQSERREQQMNVEQDKEAVSPLEKFKRIWQ